jgi:hypothetical protein
MARIVSQGETQINDHRGRTKFESNQCKTALTSSQTSFESSTLFMLEYPGIGTRRTKLSRVQDVQGFKVAQCNYDNNLPAAVCLGDDPREENDLERRRNFKSRIMKKKKGQALSSRVTITLLFPSGHGHPANRLINLLSKRLSSLVAFP